MSNTIGWLTAPSLTRLAPAITGSVALVVYARTLLAGQAFGDWGEMQTVPHVLGVAHPTGYPTYILLAWLAELVPLGSVAFRANFLSAVFVAAALATLTTIAIRLDVRPALAIAASLGTGAVGTVWAAATVAEVNPLHLLLCALLIHRALVWDERRSTVDIVLGGLLLGLALGNHLLTLFVGPFIVLYVVWVGRRELLARPWIVLAGLGAGLIGLSVYAYIPLAAARSPVLPYNHPTSLEGVWWLVSGEQFRGQFDFLSSAGPGTFIASLGDLRDLAFDRATPVLPLLGLVGIGVLIVRRTAFGLVCAGILVSGGYVWANYLRLEHYLLVPWLVLGIGTAAALEAIVRAVALLDHRAAADAAAAARAADAAERRRVAGTGVAIVALALAVILAGLNWMTADRSDDRSGDDYVSTTLGLLPQGAAILSYWDASTPLWHALYVEGRRPDLLVVDDTNIVYEGWGTREARIASLICERPVYILRPSERDLVPTRRDYALSAVGTVPVSIGGPSAALTRPIYRVEPLDPTTCGG
jgi:hypothetical protein